MQIVYLGSVLSSPIVHLWLVLIPREGSLHENFIISHGKHIQMKYEINLHQGSQRTPSK